MSMWNLHRAAVRPDTNGTGGGEKGKPRPVINASLCIGCGSCVDACPETGTLALVGGRHGGQGGSNTLDDARVLEGAIDERAVAAVIFRQNHRAAGRGSELVAMEGQAVGDVKEIAGVEVLASKKPVRAAVELIGARFRDGVDYTA